LPKLIAIIDDEPEMEFFYSLVLEKALKSSQLTLKFFQDSRDFFEWFVSNDPDLILSDINMPFISGPELCHAIKLTGRSIPIYLISGSDEQDYLDVLNEIDECRFLTKPLNTSHFQHLIGLDLNLPLA
jgi:DNA-binding response OmpR family regulator